MFRRYVYRIYPTKAQVDRFQETLDLCREVYNAGIQERIGAYESERKQVSFFDQVRQLPDIKQARPEFQAINAQLLYDALNRVDQNFKRFFGRWRKGIKCRLPRYKGRSRYHSFTYPQYGHGCKVLDNGKLRLHSLGIFKVKWHRPLVGTPKTVTVARRGNKWFVSFVLKQDECPLPPTSAAIGIDVGLEYFATLSDGTQIENPRHFKAAHSQLRKAARRVARRKKGSNRRQKAVAILRNHYSRVFNQRHDFQHKLSTYLIEQYDVVAIENLNLIALAKGHVSGGAKDAAWGAFFDKLRYKAENAGRKLIEVDPRGTSQTCVCGVPTPKLWGDRQHTCLSCGLSKHRDIVSAQVILQRAVGQIAQDVTYGISQSVS